MLESSRRSGFAKGCLTFLGVATAIGSLAKLWAAWSVDGASGAIVYVLAKYQEYTSPIYEAIQPLFLTVTKWVSNITGLDLVLQDHWREIFALLSLYIGAHVSHAWKGNLPRPHIAGATRLTWGAVCVVAISVASGIVPSNDTTGVLLTIFYSTIGVALYRVGFAVQFAMDRWIFFKDSFTRALRSKLTGAALFLAVGLPILAAGYWLSRHPFAENLPDLGFGVLIALLTLLGAYHVWSATADMARDLRRRSFNMDLTDPAVVAEWRDKGGVIIGQRVLLTVLLTIGVIMGLSW